jgi:hypothetical protein
VIEPVCAVVRLGNRVGTWRRFIIRRRERADNNSDDDDDDDDERDSDSDSDSDGEDVLFTSY